MTLPRIDGDILLTLVVLVALIAVASFISVYVYGRFAKRARGAESWSLPIGGPVTPADAAVAPLTQARPGETGVIVLSAGRDAFAARVLAARAAGRGLDMMYYLWRGDLTGDLLICEVLAAADRGVRVRLLLDDINTRGLDPEYLALTGHPNIQVRLFNPAKNRVIRCAAARRCSCGCSPSPGACTTRPGSSMDASRSSAGAISATPISTRRPTSTRRIWTRR